MSKKSTNKLFSGKQKKQWLKAYRERKKQQNEQDFDQDINLEEFQTAIREAETVPAQGSRSNKRGTKNHQSSSGNRSGGAHLNRNDLDEVKSSVSPSQRVLNLGELNLEEGNTGIHGRNPLRSLFEKESKAAVQKRIREEGQAPLRHREFNAAVDWKHYISVENSGSGLPTNIAKVPTPIALPQRPSWDFSFSKETLDQNEMRYYEGWIQAIIQSFPPERLNYFERNLEVWRQLWRVLEMSDVIVVVGDARYPLLHIPYSLYYYVDSILKKPILYVLNKIDLIDGAALQDWKAFLHEVYPNLTVVEFTCNPWEGTVTAPPDVVMRKRTGKRLFTRKINYNEYLEGDSPTDEGNHADDGPRTPTQQGTGLGKGMPEMFKGQSKLQREERDQEHAWAERKQVAAFIEKIISTAREKHLLSCPTRTHTTLGTVGHPNVGKSSLINCLKGNKVVSVSATPGHTKHFQTIVLRDDITLCDSPGVPFPFLDLPRALQLICGLSPIAQCREPFSAVRYLAERLPLELIFGLKKPDWCERDEEWTPWMICEGFAVKRGYYIRRGKGIPDTYRAGNQILREALSGRLMLFIRPPPLAAASTVKVLSVVTPVAVLPRDNEPESPSPNEKTNSDNESDSGDSRDNGEDDDQEEDSEGDLNPQQLQAEEVDDAFNYSEGESSSDGGEKKRVQINPGQVGSADFNDITPSVCSCNTSLSKSLSHGITSPSALKSVESTATHGEKRARGISSMSALSQNSLGGLTASSIDPSPVKLTEQTSGSTTSSSLGKATGSANSKPSARKKKEKLTRPNEQGGLSRSLCAQGLGLLGAIMNSDDDNSRNESSYITVTGKSRRCKDSRR